MSIERTASVPSRLAAEIANAQACGERAGTLKGEIDRPFEHAAKLEALLTRQAELERTLDLNKSEQQVVEDQDQKDGAGVVMGQTNGEIPPGDLGETGGAGTEQYVRPRARGNRSPASCEPQPQ